MEPVLHQKIVEFTADVITYCLDSGQWQSELEINDQFKPIFSPVNVRDLLRGVKDADFIEDVKISNSVMDSIVDIVSKPTRFQHFAYCGIEPLQSGKIEVLKYAGYCWECDPHLGWLEEIGDINTSNAVFDGNCGYYTPPFFGDHPGKITISGTTDWDDQSYPSAIDVFSFYAEKASTWPDPNLHFTSLGFALHFLQDLTVPHHVLSTLLNGHGGFEKELTSFWKRIYSARSDLKKNDVIKLQLGDAVISARQALLKPKDFKDLAQKVIERTRESIIMNSTYDYTTKYHHPDRTCALSICCNALAATLEACRLFLANTLRKTKPRRRNIS